MLKMCLVSTHSCTHTLHICTGSELYGNFTILESNYIFDIIAMQNTFFDIFNTRKNFVLEEFLSCLESEDI